MSSGFMRANLGRITKAVYPRFSHPSSLVITELGLASLPAAGMVRTTPTGMLSSASALPA